MKLTLTYAHHFLSRALAQSLLAAGHELQLLTPPALMPESSFWSAHMPVIPCDFSSSVLLKKHLHAQDVVLNLHGAASMDEDPVSQSLSVFHGALQNDVRVLHFSSHQVYGTPLYVPLDEQHPLMGSDPRTQASIATDMLAKSFAQSFDLPVMTVRLFPILGDEELLRLLQHVTPQPGQERSPQYLDLLREVDALQAIHQLLHYPHYQGQVLNLASGSLISTHFLQKIAAPYQTAIAEHVHRYAQTVTHTLLDYNVLLKRWHGRQGDTDALRQFIPWQVQHTTPEALKIWLRLHMQF